MVRIGLALLFAAILTAWQKPDIQVDVDLVTVACAVDDHNGAPVRDLKAQDFRILDDGEPRAITNLWPESGLPLTVALVADVSGSQEGFVKSHRDALSQFLRRVIGPRDRAMVVEVSSQARLIAPLTGSATDLRTAVQKIGTREGKQAPLLGPPCRHESFPHSCGGTALWHGLYYTAAQLKPVTGRKAIVVLSDGMDTASDVSLNDLIDLSQSAGVVVYSIKYASPMRFLSITAAIIQAASRGLNRLSRETGGLMFPNPGHKTDEVFSRIESDLRNLYVLGFVPPEDARDGKFHKLDVTTLRPDFLVRARSGYRAFALH